MLILINVFIINVIGNVKFDIDIFKIGNSLISDVILVFKNVNKLLVLLMFINKGFKIVIVFFIMLINKLNIKIKGFKIVINNLNLIIVNWIDVGNLVIYVIILLKVFIIIFSVGFILL